MNVLCSKGLSLISWRYTSVSQSMKASHVAFDRSPGELIGEIRKRADVLA